jgi:hypothetical protein
MKYLIFTFVFLAIVISTITAQNVDSTTVFGYAVPKPKLDSNGNPKHTFKPAFKRLGLTTGALIPLNGSEVGGTSGFRFEYGLSNKTSILLDFQGNNSQDSTFSSAQAGLLVRTMPFKARRLQPYFGAGWAIGGGQERRGNGRGRDRFTTTLANDTDGTVKNYAVVQTGLNYILFRRVIASLEGNYQVQVGGTSAQKYGGASAKLGLAYQFGKRK